MGVRFTDCPPDLVPAVQEFFGAMYSPQYIMARDSSFLRWQFSGLNGHGASDPLHLKVALVDDKLAGCVGYIPVEIQIGDRRMSAAWAANWMVDDSYRRLGLGPLLMRELSKGFELTLALGGNSDAHQLLPRMGWTDFGMLPRHVCVLNAESAAALTETGRLDWPLPIPPVAQPVAPSAVIQEVEQFDDRATALWDDTYGKTGAGTRRSAAFLNWRYQRHPNFNYVLLEAHRAGRLDALAVYRLEQVKDMPVIVLRIVELIASAEAAPAMVNALVEAGRAHGAAVIDFFCSSHRLDETLLQHGFLSDVEGPAATIPMLFQPVDRSRTGVLFLANLRQAPASAAADWYVTTADGDQDRPS
jgi:hypothetical protein